MTLSEFVTWQAGIPPKPGDRPCARFIAEWVRVKTGLDGLAIFGGLPDEAIDELLRKRRLLRAVFDGCRSIGLARIAEPRPDAIAVTRVGRAHVCAIRGEREWVARDADGVVVFSDGFTLSGGRGVRPLMIWAV